MKNSILTFLALAATDAYSASNQAIKRTVKKCRGVDPVRIQAATDKRARKNAKRLRDNMPNP